MMAVLTVENINQRFDGLQVLKNISFSLKRNEFISVIGHSGCGKTTLLRVIAGLLNQSSGKIVHASNSIGFVFQQFSLYPWLTIKENILFGKKHKSDMEIDKYLQSIGLYDYRNHYPYQISEGMKQRVAILRTLLNRNDIILMDEPFRNLDLLTKDITQQVLLRILQKKSASIIFVTHDIDEAILLSDRVIVLSDLPARIVKEFRIEFERPRKQDIFKQEDYIKLKEEIYSLLK